MSYPVVADELLDAAFRDTGLSDLGVPGWLENLDALVDSLNREAGLSAIGRDLVDQWMKRRLHNRLEVVDYRKNGHASAQRVERPWFVCGMMRSTTIPLRAAAPDPRARCLMKWESMACVPPRGCVELGPSLVQRVAKSTRCSRARRMQSRALRSARRPDGVRRAAHPAFRGAGLELVARARLPRSLQPLRHARCDATYHRQCLELLQSHAPGAGRSRRLLTYSISTPSSRSIRTRA